MGNLILPRRQIWTSQPQGLAGIDWSNPLTIGLRGVFSASNPFLNTANSSAWVASGTNAVSAGKSGRSILGSSGGSGNNFKNATIVTSGGGSYLYVAKANSSSGIGVFVNTTTSGDSWHGQNGANWVAKSSTLVATGAVVPNTDQVIAFSSNASASALFVDGTKRATGTGGYSFNGIRLLEFGLGGYGPNGSLYLSLFWLRALSDAEIQSLSANPWQIFKQQDSRIFAQLSAGSGINISAELGAATANGFTANVDRQSAIAGSLGTAAASGFSANIDRQTAIAATLGAADASGNAANIDRQLGISATLGSATADGFDADITTGSVLQISATLGTATANGPPAGIDQQINIASEVGTAISSGYLASIGNGAADALPGGGGFLYRLEQEQYRQRIARAAEEEKQAAQQEATRIARQDDRASSQASPSALPGDTEDDDAKAVSRQLQDSIAQLGALADNRKKLAAEQERQSAAEMRRQLIDAQLRAELEQQQIEEMDVVFVSMALLAA